MIAYGHPEGLYMTVLDGDVISPTDCVRQPFSRSEVGLYKAVVFVNRLNLFWNLGWKAAPEHWTRKERGGRRTSSYLGKRKGVVVAKTRPSGREEWPVSFFPHDPEPVNKSL
ncbi:MAG: hypothetical protein WCD04_12200 [Terriglobia bacterium]|jgi:hypothetical protein